MIQNEVYENKASSRMIQVNKHSSTAICETMNHLEINSNYQCNELRTRRIVTTSQKNLFTAIECIIWLGMLINNT